MPRNITVRAPSDGIRGFASLRRHPAARAQLRTEAKAIPSATVLVHGNTASIELPAPLIGGPNRFLWTENCWMLEG